VKHPGNRTTFPISLPWATSLTIYTSTFYSQDKMETAAMSRIYDIRKDLHETLIDLAKDLSEYPGQISAYATPSGSVTTVSIYLATDKNTGRKLFFRKVLSPEDLLEDGWNPDELIAQITLRVLFR